jgi:energy-coupling factor transporter ATP-binding protein EcfA2
MMPPVGSVVSIRGLSFSFFNADRRALDDISLAIGEGEFVAVTGPSGCGKSTLAMAIGGYIPHVIEGNRDGAVLVDGKRTDETKSGCAFHACGHRAAGPGVAAVYGVRRRRGRLRPREPGAAAGYVFQNLNHQIFEWSVRAEAGFACDNFGIDPVTWDGRVDEELRRFGLRDYADRHPLGLSFG